MILQRILDKWHNGWVNLIFILQEAAWASNLIISYVPEQQWILSARPTESLKIEFSDKEAYIFIKTKKKKKHLQHCQIRNIFKITIYSIYVNNRAAQTSGKNFCLLYVTLKLWISQASFNLWNDSRKFKEKLMMSIYHSAAESSNSLRRFFWKYSHTEKQVKQC